MGTKKNGCRRVDAGSRRDSVQYYVQIVASAAFSVALGRIAASVLTGSG